MAIFKDIIYITGLSQINAFYCTPEEEEYFITSITKSDRDNSPEGIVVTFYLLRGKLYQLDAPIIGRMEAAEVNAFTAYRGDGLSGGEMLGFCNDWNEGVQMILAS